MKTKYTKFSAMKGDFTLDLQIKTSKGGFIELHLCFNLPKIEGREKNVLRRNKIEGL